MSTTRPKNPRGPKPDPRRSTDAPRPLAGVVRSIRSDARGSEGLRPVEVGLPLYPLPSRGSSFPFSNGSASRGLSESVHPDVYRTRIFQRPSTTTESPQDLPAPSREKTSPLCPINQEWSGTQRDLEKTNSESPRLRLRPTSFGFLPTETCPRQTFAGRASPAAGPNPRAPRGRPPSHLCAPVCERSNAPGDSQDRSSVQGSDLIVRLLVTTLRPAPTPLSIKGPCADSFVKTPRAEARPRRGTGPGARARARRVPHHAGAFSTLLFQDLRTFPV